MPRPMFSYFLDGPRARVGKQLAPIVIKLVVTGALQRFRFTLPDNFSRDTVARGTARPKQTPWCNLQRR